MATDERGEGGGDARVEELLRVNAELAAEIRSMALGRTDVPRSSMLGASRRLVKPPKNAMASRRSSRSRTHRWSS